MTEPSVTAATGGRWTPVIGLVGGVGAGKSAAARCLERIGCVVIDSDSRAKALLDDPAVADTLVRWWGDRVLDHAGRVDRDVVAGIVFEDPAERRRLESLIHPLLAARRSETIERAKQAGAPGVVIDAPLLIEAGLDSLCDAIVFVDAPVADRLRRVARDRGWSAEELDRRQAAQAPLEIKRHKAHYVVTNTGSADDLCRQVRRVFDQIQNVQRPDRRGVGTG